MRKLLLLGLFAIATQTVNAQAVVEWDLIKMRNEKLARYIKLYGETSGRSLWERDHNSSTLENTIYGKYRMNRWIKEEEITNNPYDIEGHLNVLRSAYVSFYLERIGHHSVRIFDEIPDGLSYRYFYGGVKIKYKTLEGRTLALGGRENGIPTITIDADKWVKSDVLKRMWILAHEFGHAVYELEHGEGGRLLFPVAPKTVEAGQLRIGIMEMFSYVLTSRNVEFLQIDF